eukprot:441428-Rhodomonas_salina.1
MFRPTERKSDEEHDYGRSPVRILLLQSRMIKGCDPETEWSTMRRDPRCNPKGLRIRVGHLQRLVHHDVHCYRRTVAVDRRPRAGVIAVAARENRGTVPVSLGRCHVTR